MLLLTYGLISKKKSRNSAPSVPVEARNRGVLIQEHTVVGCVSSSEVNGGNLAFEWVCNSKHLHDGYIHCGVDSLKSVRIPCLSMVSICVSR